MNLTDIWRRVRVFDTDYPDYEINLIGEVRRVTSSNATYAGKVIGYSKDGRQYQHLGLRKDGKTTFVSRQWIAEESFPEVRLLFLGV